MFCFCEVLLAFGQNTYISTEPKWSTASPVKGSWAVTWHMASSKLQLAPSLRQAAQELLLPLPNTHLVDFLLVLLPREADTWQICEARSISYGSSARCSVSGRAGGAPRGSLWWERLRSGRAGGLLWSWWGNPAQGPAAPGGGGSREELRAPCLKSLAPEIAVKKNTLDVRACVSEKHGKRHCTSYGRISGDIKCKLALGRFPGPPTSIYQLSPPTGPCCLCRRWGVKTPGAGENRKGGRLQCPIRWKVGWYLRAEGGKRIHARLTRETAASALDWSPRNHLPLYLAAVSCLCVCVSTEGSVEPCL